MKTRNDDGNIERKDIDECDITTIIETKRWRRQWCLAEVRRICRLRLLSRSQLPHKLHNRRLPARRSHDNSPYHYLAQELRETTVYIGASHNLGVKLISRISSNGHECRRLATCLDSLYHYAKDRIEHIRAFV